MLKRRYSFADQLLIQFDQGLRTVFGKPPTTGRANPAENVADGELEEAERHESARLMRVNHCGEVCAQALYQGQALTARSPEVRVAMQQASAEENDHLDWCRRRIAELGGRTSVLDGPFYAASALMGAAAGVAGDKWSLGFLAETERQVVNHLEGHLSRLPERDAASRSIVEQMKTDEGRHATTAVESGGASLPYPVRRLMSLTSKLMTKTTYWI